MSYDENNVTPTSEVENEGIAPDPIAEEPVAEVVSGEPATEALVEEPATEALVEEPVIEAVDPDAVVDPAAEPTEEAPKKKKLVQRWWFWVIIGVVTFSIISTLALVGLYILGSNSDSSSSGSSGGSYGGNYDDDDYYGGSYGGSYGSTYITTVKNTKNSSYGITYGKAFEAFFTNTSWRYFYSSDGQNVVEFKGNCYYSGSPATVKVQFVVTSTTLTVYYMDIDGEPQSKLAMAALIDKIFESYYD